MYIKTREYFKQRKIATFIGDIYFRETFMALRTHFALALSFDKENAMPRNEDCSWTWSAEWIGLSVNPRKTDEVRLPARDSRDPI